MPAKVFTGARAIVSIGSTPIGIFDSCSYSLNIGTEAIHTLGRFGPAEITPTSYEAVTVNCSGFRVIGKKDKATGVIIGLSKIPTLQSLLNLNGITLTMTDRQDTSTAVLVVKDCIPTNWSTNVNSRTTSRFQITYVGTAAYDEGGDQVEGDDVTNLP